MATQHRMVRDGRSGAVLTVVVSSECHPTPRGAAAVLRVGAGKFAIWMRGDARGVEFGWRRAAGTLPAVTLPCQQCTARPEVSLARLTSAALSASRARLTVLAMAHTAALGELERRELAVLRGLARGDRERWSEWRRRFGSRGHHAWDEANQWRSLAAGIRGAPLHGADSAAETIDLFGELHGMALLAGLVDWQQPNRALEPAYLRGPGVVVNPRGEVKVDPWSLRGGDELTAKLTATGSNGGRGQQPSRGVCTPLTR